jgi:hypothetical protein
LRLSGTILTKYINFLLFLSLISPSPQNITKFFTTALLTVGHAGREHFEGGSGRSLGKLHNLYASINIIRVTKPVRMKWAGHIARVREMRNRHKILVRKSEGKTSLG